MGTGPIGAPNDGVTRDVAMWNGASGWQSAGGALMFLDMVQWSSTRVVGYTLQPTGTVNVSLVNQGYYGPSLVSSAFTYTQVSPYISSLATSTSSGYNTTGGGLLILSGMLP